MSVKQARHEHSHDPPHTPSVLSAICRTGEKRLPARRPGRACRFWAMKRQRDLQAGSVSARSRGSCVAKTRFDTASSTPLPQKLVVDCATTHLVHRDQHLACRRLDGHHRILRVRHVRAVLLTAVQPRRGLPPLQVHPRRLARDRRRLDDATTCRSTSAASRGDDTALPAALRRRGTASPTPPQPPPRLRGARRRHHLSCATT